MDKQVQYTVAAVDRALEILNLLGKSSRELGITELAKVLGVQKSTVHSLLQTMLTLYSRRNQGGMHWVLSYCSLVSYLLSVLIFEQ
ncbi:helix-turn-helix domain-containing protein [Anaerospora hongkongensis]|uniref:helix-turn-helix domain-containing protein n=1 Tax=Anaerospora hongkongensis TaxID=244830 RepID=UPI0028971AA2|nr:helix-turn-helix domain-containing protein [Anaerospora hongkongensis]